MARKIIIYGHGDMSKLGFPKEEDIKKYIAGGIFTIILIIR